MRKIKTLFIASLAVLFLNSCVDEVVAPGTSFASFEDGVSDVGIDPGSTTTKEIKIYTANITGSDRTVDLVVGGNTPATAFTAPSSVTIPANSNVATVSVDFNETGLSITNESTFTLSMTPTADVTSVGGSTSFAVALNCPSGSNKIKITVELDSWPEEVYWRLWDTSTNTVVMSNNTVAAFGGYAGLSGDQVHVECLPSGSYLFQIYDSYGDGAGAVTITNNGSTIFASSGAYGAGTQANLSW